MQYIIFDLESTCKENDVSFEKEIIEIGAVKINEQKEIVDTFSIFVRPKKNRVLTDFCKKLTTIKQSDIDKAYSFPIAAARFREWIGTEPFILCSWGFYDKSQLKKDCIAWNMDDRWIGAHISLKHQFGDIMKVKPCGMGKALKMLQLPLNGVHHRGIDDAKNIAQIFINCFERWDFK